jgi:phosphomevalonate kinase
MSTHCVISAPGKVLITGGYLVLDPAYRGLVLGTNARFYAAIQTTKQQPPLIKPTPSLQTNQYSGFIHVNAPQFTDASWVYHIQPGEDSNKNWKLVDVSE